MAIRFDSGIVFASDSQTSDPVHGIRWQTTKARRVGNHPLVIGFSGNTGIAQRAREKLDASRYWSNTYSKRDLVRDMIARALDPQYAWMKERMMPNSGFHEIHRGPDLAALAVCIAEGSPQIIEFSPEGDSEFHDTGFRAIGSGTRVAYAAWQTLGGERLLTLDEGRALHVTLSILRLVVAVEMSGVSDPFTIFIINESGIREVSDEEMNALLQTVEIWENDRVAHLLGGASGNTK